MLRFATSPGHAPHPNEDFVGAVPGSVVLVDGAGIRGVEELCHHGIAWYATTLGTTLLARLAQGTDRLDDVLASAIDDVTDRHRATCQVGDPSSPSATVAIVRVTQSDVDYLLLGDSVIVLQDAQGRAEVVEDRREPDLARPLRDLPRDEAIAAFRAKRNRPGGFFVAKDDGRVAKEALVARRPRETVRAAAVLSNGASRVADRFGLLSWAEVPTHDPDDLIRLVREAEAQTDTVADDATAATWLIHASP
jgi:hypothetical protein